MSGEARAPLRPYLLSRLPFVVWTVGERDVGTAQRLVGLELAGCPIVLEFAYFAAPVERMARAEDVVGSAPLGMLEVSIHGFDRFGIDVFRIAIANDCSRSGGSSNLRCRLRLLHLRLLLSRVLLLLLLRLEGHHLGGDAVVDMVEVLALVEVRILGEDLEAKVELGEASCSTPDAHVERLLDHLHEVLVPCRDGLPQG